jgi:hypothetical protein
MGIDESPTLRFDPFVLRVTVIAPLPLHMVVPLPDKFKGEPPATIDMKSLPFSKLNVGE